MERNRVGAPRSNSNTSSPLVLFSEFEFHHQVPPSHNRNTSTKISRKCDPKPRESLRAIPTALSRLLRSCRQTGTLPNSESVLHIPCVSPRLMTVGGYFVCIRQGKFKK